MLEKFWQLETSIFVFVGIYIYIHNRLSSAFAYTKRYNIGALSFFIYLLHLW